MTAATTPRTGLVCVCATASLLMIGCGSSGDTIRLTNADAGRKVPAAVGDTLEITLQTIGPGQYGDPSLSSGSVAFLGQASAGPPNPGGVRQLYRFEALVAGGTDITIPHIRELRELPANPAFAISIDVR